MNKNKPIYFPNHWRSANFCFDYTAAAFVIFALYAVAMIWFSIFNIQSTACANFHWAEVNSECVCISRWFAFIHCCWGPPPPNTGNSITALSVQAMRSRSVSEPKSWNHFPWPHCEWDFNGKSSAFSFCRLFIGSPSCCGCFHQPTVTFLWPGRIRVLPWVRLPSFLGRLSFSAELDYCRRVASAK